MFRKLAAAVAASACAAPVEAPAPSDVPQPTPLLSTLPYDPLPADFFSRDSALRFGSGDYWHSSGFGSLPDFRSLETFQLAPFSAADEVAEHMSDAPAWLRKMVTDSIDPVGVYFTNYETIVSIGEPVVPLLVHLSNSALPIRIHAIKALGEIGGEQAAAALSQKAQRQTGLSQAASTLDRCEAIAALAAMGDENAVPLLAAVIYEEAATRGLSGFSGGSTHLGTSFLGRGGGILTTAAIAGLGEFRSEAAYQALLAIAKDESLDPAPRSEAAAQLWRFDTHHRETGEYLASVVQDPNSYLNGMERSTALMHFMLHGGVQSAPVLNGILQDTTQPALSRSIAARALAGMGNRLITPVLQEIAMNGGEPEELRSACIDALAAVAGSRCADQLTTIALDSSIPAEVRISAGRALIAMLEQREIAAVTPAIYTTLKELFYDPCLDAHERGNAALVLLYHPSAFTELATATADPANAEGAGSFATSVAMDSQINDIVRACALMQLPKLGVHAYSIYEQVEGDETNSEIIRLAAIKLMGESRDPAAAARLQSIAQDDQRRLDQRLIALQALLKRGGSEAASTCIRLLLDSETPDAMVIMTIKSSLKTDITGVLSGQLSEFALSNDLPLSTRLHAIRALEKEGANTVRKLEPLLESPVRALREATAITLAKNGVSSGGNVLVPVFERQLRSSSDWSDLEEKDFSDLVRTMLAVEHSGVIRAIFRHLNDPSPQVSIIVNRAVAEACSDEQTRERLEHNLVRAATNISWTGVAFDREMLAYANALQACPELGIHHPFRLKPSLLTEVVSNRLADADDGRKLTVAVFPRSDWNGAFYLAAAKMEQFSLHGHRLMYYEAGNDEAAIDAVAAAVHLNDPILLTPADVIIFAGHGSQRSIQYGSGGESYGALDSDGVLLDVGDTPKLARISGALKDGGRIFALACSGGKGENRAGEDNNIVNVMRRTFPHAEPGGVGGSTVPFNPSTLDFEFDNDHNLIRIDAGVELYFTLDTRLIDGLTVRYA